jgi:hypothetical protein
MFSDKCLLLTVPGLNYKDNVFFENLEPSLSLQKKVH